jgi:hypothetical protein
MEQLTLLINSTFLVSLISSCLVHMLPSHFVLYLLTHDLSAAIDDFSEIKKKMARVCEFKTGTYPMLLKVVNYI